MSSSDEDRTRSPARKRDDQRVEIPGDIHGEIMVFHPMAIKEISHNGAQVETVFSLHVDSLHDVRLTLGDRSVVLKARVAHSSVAEMDQELVRYRSGLEFVEPSDRVGAVISEFIETLRRRPQTG